MENQTTFLKNPLNELGKNFLKLNKRRNYFVLLAIILTTVMFTALTTIGISMKESEEKAKVRVSGSSAHLSFKRLTTEQAEQLATHPFIQHFGIDILVGVIGNPELSELSTELVYGDENYAKMCSSYPTTGKMPEKIDEIALDKIVLKALGVAPELGNKVTLQYKISPSEKEYREKTFTICGVWEGDPIAYTNHVLVSKEFVQDSFQSIDQQKQKEAGEWTGLLTLYVQLDDTYNLEEKGEQIIFDSGLAEDGILMNPNWAYTDLSDSKYGVIIISLLILLISISGYLIINTIFQISFTRDIYLYGILKAVGATKQQQKKIIMKQAIYLSFIGIPLGEILGFALGYAILPIIMKELEGNFIVSINPLIFIIAAIFSFITIIISTNKAGMAVCRLSPVQALNYTEDFLDKIKKSQRNSKKKLTLYKIAYLNLWRRKKTTISVIASLSLGFILILCIYAVTASFDTDKFISDYIVGDFCLADYSDFNSLQAYNFKNKTISEDFLNQLTTLSGVKTISNEYVCERTVKLKKKQYQKLRNFYEVDRKDAYDFMSKNPDWLKAYQNMVDNKIIGAQVYGADEWLLRQGNIYIGELDWNEFEKGNHVIMSGIQGNSNNIYEIGDQVKIDGKEYTVMAYIELPISAKANETSNTVFSYHYIIPANYFRNIYPNTPIYHTYLEVEKHYINKTEDFLKSYQEEINANLAYHTKEYYIENFENEIEAQMIIGKMLSLIIAIIGILNFINSMVSSYLSRNREIAILQGIGMTKKQVLKMFFYESLEYITFILGITIILASLLISTGIKSYLAESYTSTYHFTLAPVFIITPILLFISIILPSLCFHQIDKRSIVERIEE